MALDPAYLEVYPETGAVYRLDARWARARGAAALVVVDYTAGFDPIPADVQSRGARMARRRWGNTGRDPGLRSETIPDLITQVYGSDTSASAGTIPAGARDLLAPYRIWTV